MRKKVLTLIFLFAATCTYVFGQGDSRYTALFLYKFGQYVEWPENGNDKVIIGVIENEELYEELYKFSVSREYLEVHRVSTSSDTGNCNVLFLSKDQSSKIGAYKKSIGKKSVLLVSDDRKLTNQGADIALYSTSEGKMGFQVNIDAMRRKGLTPSQKLLTLAKST